MSAPTNIITLPMPADQGRGPDPHHVRRASNPVHGARISGIFLAAYLAGESQQLDPAHCNVIASYAVHMYVSSSISPARAVADARQRASEARRRQDEVATPAPPRPDPEPHDTTATVVMMQTAIPSWHDVLAGLCEEAAAIAARAGLGQQLADTVAKHAYDAYFRGDAFADALAKASRFAKALACPDPAPIVARGNDMAAIRPRNEIERLAAWHHKKHLGTGHHRAAPPNESAVHALRPPANA